MQTPGNNNQKINYPVDEETLKTAKKSQQEDNMDNPVVDEEAQNVTDGTPRMNDKDAEDARNKANEGKR